MSKTLCIIPARGGSKRFPGKNTAIFNGKPLVTHAIEVGQACGIFDKVCVSSDDGAVLSIAREHAVEFVHERPENLAGDTVPLKALCLHLLQECASKGDDYDTFALLIPVSPFRTADDITAAHDLLQPEDVDTVMSVVRYAYPPQVAQCIRDGFLQPFYGIENMKRSQDLEPLYHHDGTIIFCKTAPFLERKEFYGPRMVPYEIAAGRTVNIDEPLDLAWAEFLLTRQQR